MSAPLWAPCPECPEDEKEIYVAFQVAIMASGARWAGEVGLGVLGAADSCETEHNMSEFCAYTSKL